MVSLGVGKKEEKGPLSTQHHSTINIPVRAFSVWFYVCLFSFIHLGAKERIFTMQSNLVLSLIYFSATYVQSIGVLNNLALTKTAPFLESKYSYNFLLALLCNLIYLLDKAKIEDI